MMNDLYVGCEKRYEVVNYYSLAELVDLCQHDDIGYDDNNPEKILFGTNFIDNINEAGVGDSWLLANYPSIFKTSGALVFINSGSIKLLNAVGLKYYNHIVFSVNEEDYNSEYDYTPYCRKFLLKVLNKLNETQDRYIALIAAYASLENKLLDKVKSSSETSVLRKFNDTPQNDFNGADFTVDGYLSSVGKDTSDTEMGSDVMTPIQRLEEIRRHYADIQAEWIKEFDSLFLEEANV